MDDRRLAHIRAAVAGMAIHSTPWSVVEQAANDLLREVDGLRARLAQAEQDCVTLARLDWDAGAEIYEGRDFDMACGVCPECDCWLGGPFPLYNKPGHTDTCAIGKALVRVRELAGGEK